MLARVAAALRAAAACAAHTHAPGAVHLLARSLARSLACALTRPRRPRQAPVAGAASGSGVVLLERMEGISKQLAKNYQYMQHGPGLPTAVAVHGKFLAVGTSRSLVLLFDHFQVGY